MIDLRKMVTRVTFGSVAAAALFVGCSSSPETTVPVVQKFPSSENLQFYDASTTTAAHPELGVLNVQIGDSSDSLGAELLAPTLGVTSLRSVARTSYIGGSGTSGASSGTVCSTVGAPYDPSQFQFVLNNDLNGTKRNVTRLILNGQTTTCDGNLAFFVLDSPITGVTFPQLQLDQIPAPNDPILACSFGATDIKCTLPSTYLCAPGNLIINNGGYYAADQDKFPAGVAVATVAGCTSQDRGSGMYDLTGNLLGVFDRPFNADKTKVATLADPCGDCPGAVSDAQLLSSQVDYIARAFAAVGSSPWRVGHPQPADIGGACSDSLDCNSQYCVGIGTAHYCSQSCDSAACPASSVCSTVDGQSICLPAVTPHPASCAATPATNGTRSNLPVYGGFLLVGAVLRKVFSGRKKQAEKKSTGNGDRS